MECLIGALAIRIDLPVLHVLHCVADFDALARQTPSHLRDFRTEANGRMDGFDARLGAVEIAFAKIDQRLATLERAIIPAAQPAE